MEEENKNANPEREVLLAGKFKSVDALARAYGELEAEFTRRSQRLKALEEASVPQTAHAPSLQEEPVETVQTAEEKRDGALECALPQSKVPLMGAEGARVAAPQVRCASIREAGALALGYLKRQHR